MINQTDLTKTFDLDLHAELVEEAKASFETYKRLINWHRRLDLVFATYRHLNKV